MARIRGPHPDPREGEALVSSFGLNAVTDEVGLAEKGEAAQWGWDVERVPASRLVASDPLVDAGLVSKYRAYREWEDRPIDVVERGGRYFIIDGHHRAAAAVSKDAGAVPARVRRPSLSL
jgi:hypothetical protein